MEKFFAGVSGLARSEVDANLPWTDSLVLRHAVDILGAWHQVFCPISTLLLTEVTPHLAMYSSLIWKK